DPAACVVEPNRQSATPGLVHPRPRPEGRAVRARRTRCARDSAAVRHGGSTELSEDERLDGTARADTARRPLYARAKPGDGGAHRALGGPRAFRHRYGPAPAERPGRQGLYRLSAERSRTAARRTVQRAAGAWRDRIDAATLEPGNGEARHG